MSNLREIDLPVAPALDTQVLGSSTTPRKRGWMWIVLAAGLALSLTVGLVGWFAGRESTSTPVPKPAPVEDVAPVEPAPIETPEPVEPVEPSQDELEAEAAGESLPYIKAARRDFSDMSHISTVGEGIRLMDSAARNTDRAAEPWYGVDYEVYDHLSSAADHIHNAADAARAYDLSGMKSEFNAGLREIKLADRALDGGSMAEIAA